jgi:hypothetical protein
MTTYTTSVAARHEAVPPADVPQPRRALSARRWFLVASPVLAGLFAVVGAYFDPAATISGKEMYEISADEPGPLQLKSLGFHWSYAFWMLPALLVAPYVRSRGAWLANVTAFIGFAGMTTLPGLLIVDYYDSAIGQLYGVQGTDAVSTLMDDTMWGLPVFALPGMIGLLLSLPLTAITLWRAGLARWWALVPVLAGFACFDLSGITWWGCLAMTACYAGFSVVLHRATDPERHPV